MPPMNNRFVIFLVIVTITLGFLWYDLALHFTNNPSLTSSVVRRLKAVKNDTCSPCPAKPKTFTVDHCFDSFMQLFKRHNMSGNVFFSELNPPMPVSAVSSPCRQFLVPKSVNATRLKELVRCYAPKFVTYKTIGKVRRGLRIVKKIFDDNKVPLILCGGSLIGSHRYHGLIPYDDDFDFFIPSEKRSFIKQQLTDLCKRDASFRCLLTILPHLQLLIGVKNQTKRNYASFIDFFSYSKSKAVKANTAEATMFPLIKRPLEGDLYDSVNDYPSYYKYTYGKGPLDICNSYDHKHKTRVKGCQPVKCEELNSFLPFVVVSETSVGRLEIGVNASFIRSLFFHRKSHGVFVS